MAKFPPLPERPHGGFRTLYIDPPWSFSAFSEAGEAKNPKAHYGCESVEDLKGINVDYLMARNAACFMWATFPMLREALDLLAFYGFEYKTGGAWAKQSSTGAKLAFGTGYIFRSASELLLVGTRGSPVWTSKSVRNLWLAPVREHSRKPDKVIEDIERLTIGPRLEMFGRQRREGWVTWGNEADKFAPGLTPVD